MALPFLPCCADRCRSYAALVVVQSLRARAFVVFCTSSLLCFHLLQIEESFRSRADRRLYAERVIGDCTLRAARSIKATSQTTGKSHELTLNAMHIKINTIKIVALLEIVTVGFQVSAEGPASN